MKNVLIVLLLAALVVLAALHWKAGQTAEKEPAANEPVASDTDRLRAIEKRLAERDQELAQLRALLAEARAQRTAAEEKAAAAPPPATLAVAAPRPEMSTNTALGQIIQAVTSAMTNPAAMRSLRQNMGAWSRMRENLYDDLMERAQLTDVQRGEFQRLMRLRRNAQFMGGLLGEEEARQRREEAEAGLKTLLGARYDELETYEKQMPARMFAERFDLFLDDRRTDLAPATKARLIDALARIPGMQMGEPGSQFSAQLGSGKNRDFGAAVERQLDQTVKQYDEIVTAAKPILSAEENKALDEFLGERLQEKEMGASLTKAILPALFGTNATPFAGVSNAAISVETIVAPPVVIESNPR